MELSFAIFWLLDILGLSHFYDFHIYRIFYLEGKNAAFPSSHVSIKNLYA
jgi:hypothetical protein